MEVAVSSRKLHSIWRAGLTVALLAGVLVPIAAIVDSGPAAAQAPATAFNATAPALASITSPSSCTATSTSTCAPWNEWQGDPGTAGAPNATDAQNCSGTQSTGYGSNCLLFPTYNPTGGATTTTANGVGGAAITEPNLSVSPGASSGTDGVAPYPSGSVGTPGPLDAYCGSGDQPTESTQSVSRMTPGTTLPLAPAYFPHIVRNADGTLTGYFDYRPKDADEALVAATSTDGGADWTYQGEALEQNPGYCPSVDVNDDGKGHANVVTLANGNTFLYTLPRAAGDMQGVGLDLHEFTPTEANPLGTLPAADQTGVDPNAFATAAASVPTTGGVTIAVTETGSANSPQQLVTGGFVDLTQDPAPNANEVINCTVSGYTSLTGCTSTTPITVNQNDLIEQVIGYVSAQTGTATIPVGPNTTNGDGGLGTIDISPTPTAAAATSGSTNLGFTDPLTGSTYNADAPNRVYFNGTTAYCSQSNNNPTTKIENCTTGPNGTALPLSAGMVITSDPIISASAYASDPASGGATTGLVAPDGIVGVLPSYPGVPSGATAVMYTEKELNYYLAGDSTNAIGAVQTSKKAGVPWGAGAQTIDFIASPYITENMPNPAAVSATTPVTVTMGLTLDDLSGTTAMVPITCTGLSEAGAASTLTGCTVPVADQNYTEAAKTYVGAPGAATVALSALEQQGEGSASNAVKLYKNNEDVSILRVAYTTDGSNFSYAGLANDGIVSDCVSTTSTVTLQNQSIDPGVPEVGCSGSYQGVNNPDQQNNPPNGLNSYAANEGTPGGANGTDTGSAAGGDATEMRWVGSAGSIIVNPNGTYGLFLSGAWAADGDSDAFNQVFYSEGTTSTNGQGQSTVTWSTPAPVVSTDYSFAASYNQDNNVNGDGSQPVGVSAYYEGRAYGPSVVQNPNGTLTMVFAGYRFPKSIVSAGSVLGDQATGGSTAGAQSPTWTVGQNDLTMYRNILTTTLTPSTSPGVSTTTTVAASPNPATFGQTEVLTATVAPVAPGTGTPTGEVTFSGDGGTVCQASLDASTPDTASCDYPYLAPTTDSVTASYAGDSNYAGSTSTTPAPVDITQATPTTPTISNLPASGIYGDGFTASVSTDGDGTTSVTSSTPSVCTASGLDVSYVGVGQCTLTAHVAAGTDYGAADGSPQSFDVDAAVWPVTVTGSQPYGGTPTFTPAPSSGPTEPYGGTLTCGTVNGGTAISPTLGAGGSDTIDSSSCSGLTLSGADATDYTLGYSGSTFTVGQATPTTPTISNLPSSATYGGGFTASVSTNGDGTTSVTSSTSSVCTASGLSVSYVGVGPCTLTAHVAAGTDYGAADGSAQSFSVGQAQSTVSLGSSASGAVVSGQHVTFTATVGPVAPASSTPPGTVTFSFSAAGTACSSGSNSVTLSGGVATCTVSAGASASPLKVSASYAGSTDFASSVASQFSKVITKDASSIALSASASPDDSGQPVTFIGAVSAAAPGSGAPTGSASWSITDRNGNFVPCASTGATTVGSTLDETCTLTLLASASPYGVKVTYNGDTNFTGSTKSSTEQVVLGTSTTKVAVAASGSKATLTVKVKGSPAGSKPTGKVTFIISSSGNSAGGGAGAGKAVVCSGGSNVKTLSGGTATCALTGLSSAESPYSVYVTYPGNADFGPSVSTTKTFNG